MIDETQFAFVHDKKILDVVLIANEAVSWLRERRKEGVLLKLDFQSAYDTVRWDIIEQVLRIAGFGEKWIKWVMASITSASILVILNGSPLKLVKMDKNVRQGDPLSPYLFILVCEALVFLVRKAECKGLLSPLMIGEHHVPLKHLQFADNTLLFAPLDEEALLQKGISSPNI